MPGGKLDRAPQPQRCSTAYRAQRRIALVTDAPVEGTHSIAIAPTVPASAYATGARRRATAVDDLIRGGFLDRPHAIAAGLYADALGRCVQPGRDSIAALAAPGGGSGEPYMLHERLAAAALAVRHVDARVTREVGARGLAVVRAVVERGQGAVAIAASLGYMRPDKPAGDGRRVSALIRVSFDALVVAFDVQTARVRRMGERAEMPDQRTVIDIVYGEPAA